MERSPAFLVDDLRVFTGLRQKNSVRTRHLRLIQSYISHRAQGSQQKPTNGWRFRPNGIQWICPDVAVSLSQVDQQIDATPPASLSKRRARAPVCGCKTRELLDFRYCRKLLVGIWSQLKQMPVWIVLFPRGELWSLENAWRF